MGRIAFFISFAELDTLFFSNLYDQADKKTFMIQDGHFFNIIADSLQDAKKKRGWAIKNGSERNPYS